MWHKSAIAADDALKATETLECDSDCECWIPSSSMKCTKNLGHGAEGMNSEVLMFPGRMKNKTKMLVMFVFLCNASRILSIYKRAKEKPPCIDP